MKQGASWCREGDLNPHRPFGPADFKSAASASFAIPAKVSASRGSQGRQDLQNQSYHLAIFGSCRAVVFNTDAPCRTRCLRRSAKGRSELMPSLQRVLYSRTRPIVLPDAAQMCCQATEG